MPRFSEECIIFQMPKSKLILTIGFFIAILPFLGFPQGWNSLLQFAGGFSIVFLSVLISIDKRLSLKAKMEKRAMRKRALMTEVNNSAQEYNPPDQLSEAPTE